MTLNVKVSRRSILLVVEWLLMVDVSAAIYICCIHVSRMTGMMRVSMYMRRIRCSRIRRAARVGSV